MNTTANKTLNKTVTTRKRSLTKMLFIAIFLLASFLRLFKLGALPVGLSWDEAATGYNGYGIATVHRDEWLNRMPISFKSFGDYKAAVAIYLNAITTTMFGLNSFAIRLPAALAGIATVVAAYWIGRAIFAEKSKALLLMFLVAISPLNIHYSRIAFESGIAVALVASAVAFFLHAFKHRWMYLASAVCVVLSLYAYHSTKIAVPFFVITFVVMFWECVKKDAKWICISALFAGIMLFPLVRESIQGKASERFFMTSSITNGKNIKPIGEVAAIIEKNYALHLDTSFLLFGKTSTYRHGNGVFGILSFIEFALILFGLISFADKDIRKKYWWIIALILFAVLPAAISNESPHSNRAHLVIPWLQVAAIFGVEWLSKLKMLQSRKSFIVPIIYLFSIVQLLWQTSVYVSVYSSASAKDFQFGYEEAVKYAKKSESEVDKVLFTSAYGQPYIYILLYKKLTPIQFQQGALANYEIRDLNWESDKNRQNILIVGTPKEIPADYSHIVKEIRFPDGEVAFRIVKQ